MCKKIFAFSGIFILSIYLAGAETFSAESVINRYNEQERTNGNIFIYSFLAITIFLLAVAIMRIGSVRRRMDEIKGINPATKITWLSLFFRKDSTKDADLQGHIYDGIQEYDNNPPAWFNWLLYTSIVAAAGYMLYFHVFKIGKLSEAEYQQELADAKVVVERAQEKGIMLADLPEYKDEAKLIAGKITFTANCASCHGDKAQGNVGPNLTDDYWIHGGQYKQVFTTIFNGVPEKGMLSWKKSLKPEQIREVASYVASLKGTNPPNPKAPQGVRADM